MLKRIAMNNVEPVAGQTITDPDGSTVVATTTSDIYDMYIPAQNVMGYDNPEYGWNIDRFGSGQMTFAEGQPQLGRIWKVKNVRRNNHRRLCFRQ